MTNYQELIYKTHYARWNGDRRENWLETTSRYNDFFEKKIKYVGEERWHEYILAIEDIDTMQVMPSMRALWTAGKPLEISNIAGYNCAYLSFEKPRDFAEHLYILMNGAGSGYTVERQYISKLPTIPDEVAESSDVIIVEDSKLGWANATADYFELLYEGQIPTVDYSFIRPKGAILKTFGGRASGKEPLVELFTFAKELFINAAGRKLNSIEVNDIACFIANVVVSGGVRRSSCISLSNLSDRRMANAKTGEFWLKYPYRAMANNSTVYTEKPEMTIFTEEWLTLMKSGTGERGIVNRKAMHNKMKELLREVKGGEGTNPCGEITLHRKQFCNLSEVVIRPTDNIITLARKVRSATILGILQSTLTDFTFINNEWEKNAKEERLLGVSLTGLRDHYILSKNTNESKLMLASMKIVALSTATEWAMALKINVPKAITTVKPSGTVSQLVGCSSGLHTAYSRFYIRRLRVSRTDPICQLLIDSKVPYFPENGYSLTNATTYVFEFPMMSAPSAVLAEETTAIEQLEYWQMLTTHWTDHNASCTIYVKDEEWLDVGAWVYKNFDTIIGLSFLSINNHVYKLAPYEKITEKEYYKLSDGFPEIDFDDLSKYEKSDNTEGAKMLACVGGSCEI